jgi:predicted RNA-binding Zn-ribbon protein involved in translation (DUF1610 family)
MKSISEFKKDKRGATCLNCEKTISPNDHFCPNCGQINNTSRISLNYYFSEYLTGFFSFDNRFFKTIIPLLFKPGKVTREFIEGKRKKYVNPFQLYLNITIIFFLLIGLFSTIDNFRDSKKMNNIEQNESEDLISALDSLKTIVINKDSISTTKNEISIDFTLDSLNNSSNKNGPIISSFKKIFIKVTKFIKYDEEHDKVNISIALKELGYEDNYWNVFYYSKAKNINKYINDPDFRKSYSDNLISKISIALFLLLPVFTLFVSLLYIRNKYNYSEHLVFVFHTQTVFFILLILSVIIDRYLTSDWATTLAIFLFLSYLFVALRNFYKQGKFKTFIKFIILNSFYFVLALIGGILVSFIAFVI